jgi:hypothetical protein
MEAHRESLDSGLDVCQHETSEFYFGPYICRRHAASAMDFAPAWVRRESSSSAGCRKQILRPQPFPESVGWAEPLEEDASVARVES